MARQNKLEPHFTLKFKQHAQETHKSLILRIEKSKNINIFDETA